MKTRLRTTSSTEDLVARLRLMKKWGNAPWDLLVTAYFDGDITAEQAIDIVKIMGAELLP
jgi:hypothetical protein